MIRQEVVDRRLKQIENDLNKTLDELGDIEASIELVSTNHMFIYWPSVYDKGRWIFPFGESVYIIVLNGTKFEVKGE